jgi:hypothetical protein
VVSASVSPATRSGRGDRGSRVRCQSVVPSQIEKRQSRLYMYKRKNEARSPNQFYHGKVISITYSQCMCVALLNKHTKRMRPIVLPCVSCLTMPHFCTLSHKRHHSGKNVLNMECVL